MSQPISRRTLLRGIGTSLALPLLDAMLAPTRGFAAPAPSATIAAPVRMGFVYVPNGMNMAEFLPTKAGTDFEFTPTLQSLAPFKDDLLVISGLAHDKARGNGDGAGDHARSMATYLTGCQAKKTKGADIRGGVSVDQLAASKIGNVTRFASLELGIEGGKMSGECDSGYSCAYSHSLAWKTAHTPLPAETDPRQVFERLFGSDASNESAAVREERIRRRKSILDYVQEDARQLQRQLGTGDTRKLDEYLTGVRELEARLQRVAPKDHAAVAAFETPLKRPDQLPDHLRIMIDLMVLAWQTDTTRITTLSFANEGSNRSFPFLEVAEGHHNLSHHGRQPESLVKIARVDRFHTEQFAYLVKRLKETREGDRTLLDNSMLTFGSGIGDGDRHNHDKLPLVLVGKAGDTIKTGRHIQYRHETPLANLWLSMLDRIGAQDVEKLGDSTGRLKELVG
ncbi:MAG: DUF1552 domain-containing protein [Planctomycetota bacterium]|nr:DUF1552 domain-containing protein [Planctomycetota bacterium]